MLRRIASKLFGSTVKDCQNYGNRRNNYLRSIIIAMACLSTVSSFAGVNVAANKKYDKDNVKQELEIPEEIYVDAPEDFDEDDVEEIYIPEEVDDIRGEDTRIISSNAPVEFFPGTSVPMGEHYPNIDTSKNSPGTGQGIKGPDQGELDFQSPTKNFYITSYFGYRWKRMHYGVDLRGKVGDDIYASESGVVTDYTGTRTGYGKIVEIKHSNGFTSRYAHMSKMLVSVGDKVEKGDIIGKVGVSGITDGGSHLHFEIRHNGVPYNPEFYLN